VANGGLAFTRDAIVASMLDDWGREFAIHRDCEYLGHQSKNMLQVLIEHRGEMPARPTGFKPVEINPDALLVERAVTDIARVDILMAHCLRAYHCGFGRRRNERFHQANELLARHRKRVTRSQYMDLVRRGFDEVRDRLLDMVRAA
jgi:hypothetical protein